MTIDTMAIGEFSRRTSCAIETIRFYERVGILPKPLRRGSYRCYEQADVGRLVFVRRARELGFTLDEVRALLRLGSDGSKACNEVRELAASHLENVRTRITDLSAMERVLAEAVGRCDAGADATCPLIETLSAAPDPLARPLRQTSVCLDIELDCQSVGGPLRRAG